MSSNIELTLWRAACCSEEDVSGLAFLLSEEPVKRRSYIGESNAYSNFKSFRKMKLGEEMEMGILSMEKEILL